MKRFFKAISLCALALSVLSCADDNTIINEIGSQLQTEKTGRVSIFNISNKSMEVPEGTAEIDIFLRSVEEAAEVLTFRTDVEISGERLKCSIMIPAGTVIPDGRYTLRASMLDGTSLGARLDVLFKNEMLYQIEGERVAYTSLQGEGTSENPYLIKSQSDFNKLLYNLDRDTEYHGRGLYFLQTKNIEAPPVSTTTDGRGYGSESFAGIYDGGGYSITGLNYIGNSNSEKDRYVGLFNELLDGASVSNLTLSQVSLNRVYEYCGALAGAAYGNVTVSNVKVSGSIFGEGKYVGGLVGYVDGKLTVKKYDLNMTIEGKIYVGGLVGFVEDGGELDVSGVTTRDRFFTVTGGDCVGGLAGMIEGRLKVSEVNLEHTLDVEDSDVKIISASGNYCGGLAGWALLSGEGSVSNVKIQCPVESAGRYAGGLAGFMSVDSKMSVRDVKCSSMVKASEHGGGFVGKCNVASGASLVFEGENKFAVEDGRAVSVHAGKYAGGIFGELSGSVSFSDVLTVAANVSGDDLIGGLVGALNETKIDLTKTAVSSTMRVNGKKDVGGLFGYAVHSEIRGPNKFDYAVNGVLRVPKKSDFKSQFGGIVSGETNVGGLAGRVERTEIKAVSISAAVDGYDKVGGLVGVADYVDDTNTRLEDCTFMGTVKGGYQTGGIAGKVFNGGDIIDCINYGNVEGKGKTGGVIGMIDYTRTVARTYYCVNTGYVAGESMVGGVVGYMDGDSQYIRVQRCGNYGFITASGDSGAGLGGIVGGCEGTKVRVISCANHGEIKGTGPHHGIGGIAGTLGNDPGGLKAHQSTNLEVGWCCNKGKVHSSNPSPPIGGILGYQEEGCPDEDDHDSWLHDCYNYGAITSDQDDDTGGILGKVDHYGVITYCINFGKVSYGNAVVGTRKSGCIFHQNHNHYLSGSGKKWESGADFSEGDKTKESTFGDFDFTYTWEMTSSGPILRDCPFQNVAYSE